MKESSIGFLRLFVCSFLRLRWLCFEKGYPVTAQSAFARFRASLAHSPLRLGFVSLLFGGLALSQSTLAQTPPNIVIILADDLGYGDVGFNGCPDFPTPNIDSIASNGVLCTDGYVTDPVCSPSRAGLLTGRYQQRFGHESVPQEDATNARLGLPMSEVLLPQILKPAGYVCGAIGKWHLGLALNFHPMNRGFDEFYGFLGGAANYFNTAVFRDYTPTRETAYLTDGFTREGVSFIDRHATQPFFLYLAYNAPHEPYQAPQRYLDRVAYITDPNRRLLAAMITALDDGVGQVLQALQANNLLDNTLIFFLSDNGAPFKTFTRNFPLRGYKSNTLEGGIRVPFAVQWTGRLPGHVVYQKPISSLDIVATAAAAAGVSLPADRVYDGMNVIRYLAGEQISPPRNLFWRWLGLGSEGPPGSLGTIWAVRSDDLKLVTERNTEGEPPALYSLPNDIGETNNLAASQPEDVDSLKVLYDKWNLHKISPLWQPPSDFNSALTLVGDWNAWNKDDPTLPWRMPRITAPPALNGTPDAFNWFTNTIHVAATGGDTTPGVHAFAIVGDSSYSYQWGGVSIRVDDTTNIPFFSGSSLGPTNSISLDDGFYYSFRILDPMNPGPANLGIAVMKTSAPPIHVDRRQTPGIPTPNEPINVSIVASQPPSVEERIYLRWSTDFFITSQLIPAVGSGVDYSATIPGQPAGTVLQYSIITSTVDLSPFFTPSIIDALTLASSSAFQFIVSDGTSTPTPTPTSTPTPTATPTATPTPTPTPTSTPTVQVTVQTNAAGSTFMVDGTSYSSTQTFSWVPGSSHTIATTSPQSGGTGVQYVWTKWSDNGAISHTVTPSTNKTYTATFTTQYYLTMTHGTGGTVRPASGWKNSGATVPITARPANGYSFSNWSGSGTGSYSGTNNPASITMTGPITETATFTHN